MVYKSEPTLELISRAAPSVEAHHRSVGPDAGINSGGRQITKKKREKLYSRSSCRDRDSNFRGDRFLLLLM